ncbi:MAG: phage tailspike protein [Plesiomonas sp.]
MTANIMVTSPYQPFTLPNKFSAVFNGYIYCGLVDKDPLVPANQVQIYLVNESGAKVPVSQPLRTNAGGFLVYNGKPAKFVTESNHSLLVQDGYKSQVWYEPDLAKSDPSSMWDLISSDDGSKYIGFIQSGYGAARRSALEKMREVISLDDFNPAGDGVTDDTEAFKNAILASRGGLVYVPGGRTYVVNNLDVAPSLYGSAINKPILKCTASNSSVFLNKSSSPYGASSVYVENVILETSASGCNAYKAEYGSDLSYTDSAMFVNVDTSASFDASYVGNFIFCKWIRCRDGLIGSHPSVSHQFVKAVQYGQVNDNLFEQCRIYNCGNGDNGLKAIEATWANGNSFYKCNFEFCYGGIIKLTGGYSNKFTDCWFETGLHPSLPGRTLPLELFQLEYLSSGPGAGSQPRGFTIDKCVIAIGTIEHPMGIRTGGAIFRSTTGSGGEWTLRDCTFYGERPDSVGLYDGPFPEGRISYSNNGNASGTDPAVSFYDLFKSTKIIGQKSVNYTPELYIVQNEVRPTFIARSGFCVVSEKTVTIKFDIEWSNLPATPNSVVAMTMPNFVRLPKEDTFVKLTRLSGFAGSVDGYEIIGKINTTTRRIELFIKQSNTATPMAALPPVHAPSGRLIGEFSYITITA